MQQIAVPTGIRNPYVRTLALGRMTGGSGLQIMVVAVGWQLYERTGSAWSLGLLGAVELIPILLLMIPAGNIADRVPRKFVAMFAHTIMAGAAAGLAMTAITKAPNVVIYAMIVLIGTARAFSSPSVGTILPQLIPKTHFAHANAWVSSCSQFAAAAGPAIGGLLIALSGSATLAYIVACCLQLVFVGLLATLPKIASPPVIGRRSASDIFAGFKFIRGNPIFLAAITLDLFAVLLGGAMALLPIFAKDILEVGPTGLGWLRAAPAVGAMMAGLIQTRLPPWNSPGRVMLWAVVGFGLATIGFGLSTSFFLSMICLFLTGTFDSLSVVIRTTLEQSITPDPLRGRVAAINFVFIGMSNELGAFESGATAALFGTVASVVMGGVGTLIVVGAVLAVWPQFARIGPLHTLVPGDGGGGTHATPKGA